MRPTRNDMLMEMAVVVSKRSTCNRLSVGAVVSRGGRVLSTGYNGPPSGLAHCAHPEKSGEGGEPCNAAVHAEHNAITWAAREGTRLLDSELHVTHMPCLKCSQSIINAGIKRVTYWTPYRDTSGVELLKEANVRCIPYFERMDE